MNRGQHTLNITGAALLERVRQFRGAGYRLAQIGCNATGGTELIYSFEKDYAMVNLRLQLIQAEEEVPSISGIYRCAFLYENEIRELFGVNISGISVDYKGKFYRMRIKAPFRPVRGEGGGS